MIGCMSGGREIPNSLTAKNAWLYCENGCAFVVDTGSSGIGCSERFIKTHNSIY